jgi:hypothetical protein
MAITAGLAKEEETMLKRAYAALVAALAAAGIFLGNAAHAQTLPNIVIGEPSAGHLVYDVVTVSAGAYSPSQIVSVTAAVDGRSVSLVMPVCTPRGALLPCPVGWRGDLDIAGLPRGNLTLAVTATDAMGNVGTTTMTIVHGPLRLTDLDGDGKSDLLYRNASTGLIYRLLMDGLSIKDTAFAYYEPDPDWHVVADADFDGDGISDLLWRNQRTGFLYMQFFGKAGVPVGGEVFWIEPNLAWEIVAILDFDGDGKADILWQNRVTRELYAMLMDGARIVGQRNLGPPSGTFARMIPQVVGDFVGRGTRNGILWRDPFDGSVCLMGIIGFSNGTFLGPLQSPQPIYTEPDQNWGIVAAADFDGDGKSDILWRNVRTGEVWMMLMDGGTIATQGSIYREPNLDWTIASVGDYDGDGKSDILWRNTRTGEVWMMLMNGLSIASQGMVYTMPDTNWYLLGSSNYPRGSGYVFPESPH